MTRKERVYEILTIIKKEHCDLDIEDQWMLLLDVVVNLAKKEGAPDLINAFFRLGLEAGDIMEQKRQGWTKLMEDGKKNSIKILHAMAQTKDLRQKFKDELRTTGDF